MNSVVTTRNLLDACVRSESLRRFVNISSFAVYSNINKRSGNLLDETCPMERRPDLRGEAYTFAKAKQEELVAEYGQKFGIPVVQVRPGAVYGPGNPGITGRVGIGTFGLFLHLGGGNRIPLTYVDNCADAIVLAGIKTGVSGEAFNVVDDDLPTSRQFLRLYKREVREFSSLYLPKFASYALCYLWEWYSTWSSGQLMPPAFNRRRWNSFWKSTRYSNLKLKAKLGWNPKVSTKEGLRRYMEACRTGDARVLRLAIVGCGKIADSHAAQIQRIEGCEIVGVCDREPLMARQLYERFAVKAHYSDVDVMLRESRPDVVHITTPPTSHFELATQCLKAGAHVYVEKPFTLYEHEAQELIRVANERGLKITAGHDDQFSQVSRRMRSMVQKGFLGSRAVVHMESYYCYELSDTGYAGALLGDKRHWIRRLPGKLLQNIISHGVARIAEQLSSDSPTVVAQGRTSEFLRSRGETELIDELRVLISEEGGTTASFVFSSQMRPSLHAFRIYGDKNGLQLDQDQETLIKLQGRRFTSYAEKFAPPTLLAKQYIGNLRINLGLFLRREFHMKAGMKALIEAFYQSIREGSAPPIPYREILLTARIMDSIFGQLDATHEGRSIERDWNEGRFESTGRKL